MTEQIATQDKILEGITITGKAAERLLQIRTDIDGEYLRASVTGGGCSGLNYGIAWDDTVGEYDKIFESSGIRIVVDLQALLYLKGMKIDFSSDLLSGGFKFVNPNASRTCGCGTSFSV